MSNLFAKFFTLKGRLDRYRYVKYSIISLLLFAPIIGGAYYAAVNNMAPNMPIALATLILLAVLVFIWINISLQVRRFHDLEKSGWWIMLNFLIMPDGGLLANIASWGITIWLIIFKGTEGPNKYGEDPLRKKVEPAE